MTYYPSEPYNIPTKYHEVRKNDHEDRLLIHFASDYMPNNPTYDKVKLPKSVGFSNFFRSLLP